MAFTQTHILPSCLQSEELRRFHSRSFYRFHSTWSMFQIRRTWSPCEEKTKKLATASEKKWLIDCRNEGSTRHQTKKSGKSGAICWCVRTATSACGTREISQTKFWFCFFQIIEFILFYRLSSWLCPTQNSQANSQIIKFGVKNSNKWLSASSHCLILHPSYKAKHISSIVQHIKSINA